MIRYLLHNGRLSIMIEHGLQLRTGGEHSRVKAHI